MIVKASSDWRATRRERESLNLYTSREDLRTKPYIFCCLFIIHETLHQRKAVASYLASSSTLSDYCQYCPS